MSGGGGGGVPPIMLTSSAASAAGEKAVYLPPGLCHLPFICTRYSPASSFCSENSAKSYKEMRVVLLRILSKIDAHFFLCSMRLCLPLRAAAALIAGIADCLGYALAGSGAGDRLDRGQALLLHH